LEPNIIATDPWSNSYVINGPTQLSFAQKGVVEAG